MKKEKRQLILINIGYILALCVVIAPLLWNARYNVPSADDWTYGREGYKVLQAGGNLADVLKVSFQITARQYQNWEGRFMNAFLASLQPGIWGEQYYGIVGWIMIGGLILGELIFFRELVGGERKQRLLWLPVAVPALMIQILYTPSTVESFYWYTGAVNYTFVFAMNLIFVVLFAGLGSGRYKGLKKTAATVGAVLLAVIVGGDSFSTSLATAVGIVVYYVWQFVFTEKIGTGKLSISAEHLRRALSGTWPAAVAEFVSLAACIASPGNQGRLNGNFGGGAANSALWAVTQSLIRTATNSYSWMRLPVILMVCLAIPFIREAVREKEDTFSRPGMFTLLSFGVYASEVTATLYVDGTTGGGRAAAVLYYSFHIWLMTNMYYWIGWASKRRGQNEAAKSLGKAGRFIGRYPFAYCAVMGALLAGLLLMGDKKELSSYRAYRDYKQGWAAGYAAQWQERFTVLHDESVTEAVFEPLRDYPETILYTDLQDEKGYVWVNSACARYYGKDKVAVVKQAGNE